MIKLSTTVEITDWKSIINNAESTESAIWLFTSKCIKLNGKCVPEKSVTIRHNDSELGKTLRKKNRLRQEALKSNIFLDWDKFKRIRRNVIT